MELLNEVKDYIKNGTEFDEGLALKIVEYQAETIRPYGEFLKKQTGKTHFKSISEVPPFPVDFFKIAELFALKEHKGYFESSGTQGTKSRVYYNDTSLSLYKLSSIVSYPLKQRPIKTPLDMSKVKTSSLAFMVNHFIETFGGKTITNIYEEVQEGDVLFLTAIQLYNFLQTAKKTFLKRIYIVETGGYKRFKRAYNRFKLYALAKNVFKNADFYTEYGMTELFSQFYADQGHPFREKHYLKVMEHSFGYLKVFDFANLFHISYIVVPDIIDWKKDGFEYIKRDVEDERGCSYTFG